VQSSYAFWKKVSILLMDSANSTYGLYERRSKLSCEGSYCSKGRETLGGSSPSERLQEVLEIRVVVA
jgi:hypothetical protein